MNDRLAFLRAIRANSDDDTVRLVFADWLDEQDDPLGELVRVQIELEPIRYRIDNPRAVELHKRKDELFRAHSDEWLGTNELLTNPADFGPVYRRGLPDYACLSLDTFLKNGEALFAAHPTLREVALYGLANRCSDLTMSPLLAKLDTLEIADWLTEDDAASLAVSPHLDKIGRFKLWLGGEPYFLRELVRQASTRWPREIELVQVEGGGSSGVPAVVGWREHHREQADQAAQFANTALGREVARVTRPFERLFPLVGDLGYHLCAGHLPDGSPAIAAGSFSRWYLITFTSDGHVRDWTPHNSLVSHTGDSRHYGEASSSLDSAFDAWVDEELQLELGLIWVREFSVPDLSIELWDSDIHTRIVNGTPNNPEDEPDWQDRGGVARGWLESRNFVINWFNDYWADWRGKIHSS